MFCMVLNILTQYPLHPFQVALPHPLRFTMRREGHYLHCGGLAPVARQAKASGWRSVHLAGGTRLPQLRVLQFCLSIFPLDIP